MNDPFDCQEFHELCMDYRGAPLSTERNYPQEAYERLQEYCRQQVETAMQGCWEAVNVWVQPGPLNGNGCDEQAQRNGMILALNLIAEHKQKAGSLKGLAVDK